MKYCINDIYGSVRGFMTGKPNPCGCGGNVFYYIDDGNDIIGICSACRKQIYEVKSEYVEEFRTKYSWAREDEIT